jgi:hypothetical protein
MVTQPDLAACDPVQVVQVQSTEEQPLLFVVGGGVAEVDELAKDLTRCARRLNHGTTVR